MATIDRRTFKRFVYIDLSMLVFFHRRLLRKPVQKFEVQRLHHITRLGLYICEVMSMLDQTTEKLSGCQSINQSIPAIPVGFNDQTYLMPRTWELSMSIHITVNDHKQQPCLLQHHTPLSTATKNGLLHKSTPLSMAESQHIQTMQHKMAILPRPPAT